jgi:hypothetical protein
MRKTAITVSLATALAGLPLFIACSDEEGDGGAMGQGGASGNGDGDLAIGDGDLGVGDGDGGDGDGDECKGTSVEAEPVPVNVLLVVDTSQSMEGEIASDGKDNPTKWEAIVDALGTALPQVQDLISLGLKFFPSGDTEENVCSLDSGVEVDVQPGAEAFTKIESALSAQSPGGDTPTAAALADALDYFQNGKGKDLEGENIVLLATDGGPNCSDSPKVDCTCKDQSGPSGKPECGVRKSCTLNIEESTPCSLDGDIGSCCLDDQERLCLDDGNTKNAVQDLADAGIKTIVLGMPGSEAYTDVLDELADAGGLALKGQDTKYVKVDDSEGLTSSIEDITRGVIKSCDIVLEREPPAGSINVYIDGSVIPNDDAAKKDGWYYVEGSEPPLIKIVGPTCDRVKDTGAEKISVRFGCETVIR